MTARGETTAPEAPSAGGTQPLAGLRVIDASSLYAAPFISTLLADHGADVIKIEPPGGDPYRVERRPLWAILGVWTVRRPVIRTVYLCVSAPLMFTVAYLYLMGLWSG